MATPTNAQLGKLLASYFSTSNDALAINFRKHYSPTISSTLSTFNIQLSTFNIQLSTFNSQHSTFNFCLGASTKPKKIKNMHHFAFFLVFFLLTSKNSTIFADVMTKMIKKHKTRQ
jgi:hypothetical protein